jgi:hypothetical protein
MLETKAQERLNRIALRNIREREREIKMHFAATQELSAELRKFE